MTLDNVELNFLAMPYVLAGPIVRRLTRTSVSVWIACRTSAPVDLRVRQVGHGWQSVTTTPTRVGQNLYIAALTVSGSNFAAGIRYEYELVSAAWDNPGLQPDWAALRDSGNRPSFVGLPDTPAELRMLHTSCRKPHGGGRDGLALASELIGGALIERPHLLLLSGDQIYSDDVASVLFPRIRRLAQDLVAIDESATFDQIPAIGGRQQLSEDFGLTSDAATNHLWQLGEFLAMYLLSWSDILWPATLPDWPTARDSGDLDASVTEDMWNGQLEAVNLFRASLPDVRKLLANTPCLMVFDDHEITDDWNLNHAWCTSVYGTDQGSRIMTNGLLAYTLCQHWGNVPATFLVQGSPERFCLDNAWNDGASPDSANLRTSLGIPAAVAGGASDMRTLDGTGVRYDFRLGPDHGYPLHINVLDERTVRRIIENSDEVGRVAPAAINAMLPPPDGDAGVPRVVIAPAPIAGVHLIEHLLQPAMALLPDGDTEADAEAWTAFGPGFEQLLDRLAEYQRVAILSGDVHYGFAKQLRYQKPPGTDVGIAAQLTASSAKNSDTRTNTLHLFGDVMQQLDIVRTRKHVGWDSLPVAERQKLINPPAGSLPWDDALDVMLGRTLREGGRSPAVLTEEVANIYGIPNPDWSYTIEHYDRQVVPPDQRWDPIRTAAQNGTWQGWDADKSVTMVQALQGSALLRIGWVFAGLPQIGEIVIDTSGMPVIAKYRLFTAVGKDNVVGKFAETAVDVPLDPPAI